MISQRHLLLHYIIANLFTCYKWKLILILILYSYIPWKINNLMMNLIFKYTITYIKRYGSVSCEVQKSWVHLKFFSIIYYIFNLKCHIKNLTKTSQFVDSSLIFADFNRQSSFLYVFFFVLYYYLYFLFSYFFVLLLYIQLFCVKIQFLI